MAYGNGRMPPGKVRSAILTYYFGQACCKIRPDCLLRTLPLPERIPHDMNTTMTLCGFDDPRPRMAWGATTSFIRRGSAMLLSFAIQDERRSTCFLDRS